MLVTALLAAGHTATALEALTYLAASQQADGGFAQNFWLNGVADRYLGKRKTTQFLEIWKFNRQVRAVKQGYTATPLHKTYSKLIISPERKL